MKGFDGFVNTEGFHEIAISEQMKSEIENILFIYLPKVAFTPRRITRRKMVVL